MNQITIAGHLGADPEVRFTSSGKKVTSIRVAARVRRASKDAKDDTIWWRVTVWGEQFDKMIGFFKKGSPIIVTGDLSKPEIFTDREGRSQVSMNITATDLMFSPFGKPESRDGGASGEMSQGNRDGHRDQNRGSNRDGESAFGQGKEDPAMIEDEIPF